MVIKFVLEVGTDAVQLRLVPGIVFNISNLASIENSTIIQWFKFSIESNMFSNPFLGSPVMAIANFLRFPVPIFHYETN